jgi:molybdate/tungstate transport system ATP-binding protein
MFVIRVEGLTVQVGTFRISNVEFEVPTGQYGILMGKTGSGKTTILESLCGLKKVSSGRIYLMEKNVTHLKPAERGIGFVPQDGALFPTKTVKQQIGFALSVRKWKQPDIDARVNELAELLGISTLLNRSVVGLSGGERQRIALGRALAPHPSVLCLDEPLSALDDETRDGMCQLLKSVQEKTGVTTLHITHNQSEAKLLGDVAFVIQDGKIVESTQGNSSSKPSRYNSENDKKTTPTPTESKTDEQIAQVKSS